MKKNPQALDALAEVILETIIRSDSNKRAASIQLCDSTENVLADYPIKEVLDNIRSVLENPAEAWKKLVVNKTEQPAGGDRVELVNGIALKVDYRESEKVWIVDSEGNRSAIHVCLWRQLPFKTAIVTQAMVDQLDQLRRRVAIADLPVPPEAAPTPEPEEEIESAAEPESAEPGLLSDMRSYPIVRESAPGPEPLVPVPQVASKLPHDVRANPQVGDEAYGYSGRTRRVTARTEQDVYYVDNFGREGRCLLPTWADWVIDLPLKSMQLTQPKPGSQSSLLPYTE